MARNLMAFCMVGLDAVMGLCLFPGLPAWIGKE